MEAYERLEKEFGEWVGNPNAVACSSGTAALHLALESLQLPRDSRVLIPDFTMIACARAITMAGLRPLFVDCRRDDLLMDVDLLVNRSAGKLVRAVMPVHIYGRRCDMDAVHRFTKPRGLSVVEDMAEAHGVLPHPMSDAACWSFYRNKIVSGEEGGMIVFKKKGPACLARKLRSMGFTDDHDFTHLPRAHNYRLANCLADLILPSLRDVENNLAQRRQVVQWYDDYVPVEWRMPARQSCWVYDLRVPGMSSAEQDATVRCLNKQGITARHGFKPMACQLEYLGRPGPQALLASQEVIYLPVHPAMTEIQVVDIVDALTKIVSPPSRIAASLPAVTGRGDEALFSF